MKRVIVIGSNGAGKSYFSKRLAETTGLPLVHLDVLFWRENWEHVSKEEFDALLEAELQKEEWIIDGNFQRTLKTRLDRCDTVFYFDFSTVRSLCGVIERWVRYHGKTREDMGGQNIERVNAGFLKDVLGFRKRNRKRTYRLLRDYPNVDLVVFYSRKQAMRYLSTYGSPRP